jgi:radical SAM-linked protein
MKIRIKFSKRGNIRFVGHLDLLRTLQKIFRKADIPVAYSEGFSPHQLFSIAAPLSVGISSDGEYLDMKLLKEVQPKVLIEKINRACPEGITVLDIHPLKEEEPAGMGLVCAAKYVIHQNELLITDEAINQLMAKESIIIQKKSKKGKINYLDIKPGIFNLNVSEHKILMTIATGSRFNIKPEFVLQAICEQNSLAYNRFDYTFHREELYHNEKELISLNIPKIS